MDSHGFLDASLDKLSTILTFFPSIDASGMEDELFKKKLAYPYEKDETIESFFEPLKLGREEYFYFKTIISRFRRNNKDTSHSYRK